jgi:hypothetical protein
MEVRVIICVLLFISMFPLASASTLDVSGWSFRREIVLSDSKALSDYQVKVSLDTGSLVAEGKIRPDCGDIRFTDSDRFSTLSYYLESGCNTDETVFWVNVPNVYPGKRFFVYYGQPYAKSESSGAGTFIFFDGFDGTSIDTSRWDQPACVSVGGGYSHMYSQADTCYLNYVEDIPEAGVIQLKARRGPEENGDGPGFAVSYADKLIAFEMAADAKEKRWMLYSQKPSPTSIYGSVLDMNDHVFRIAYDVSGRVYYFYVDSSLIAKNRAFSPGSLGSLHLLAGAASDGQNMSDSYYDYFFIRKYADPEPKINISIEEDLRPSSTLAENASDDPSSKPVLSSAISTKTTAAVTPSLPVSPQLISVMQASTTTIVPLASLGDIPNGTNSSGSSPKIAVNKPSIWDFLSPMLILVSVSAVASLFALYRKRRAESLKENKEVLRWISNELLSGENPDVIKKAVSDSGMDPSIVDKARKTLK